MVEGRRDPGDGRLWAAEGFPPKVDADHLAFNLMGLTTVANTPAARTQLWIDGVRWTDAAQLRAYHQHIATAGADLMRRGCTGELLSRSDYELLRMYAPLQYSISNNCGYEPFMLGLTAGNVNYYPSPGMAATDCVLPRLETILQRKDYTDAYAFDDLRPLRPEVTSFLLEIMDGFEAIPPAQRVQDGPIVRAKAIPHPGPGSVRLSASRGQRPQLLILADPIDGYWEATVPLLEPLYRATKDQVDWYFIADDICDTVFWSDYFFQPSQRPCVTFQKKLSLIERAQTAKMMEMRYVNLSIPVLLDDLAQHAEIAYADAGGISKVILIDRDGVIAMNNCLLDSPRSYVGLGATEFGWSCLAQCTALAAANIQALLANQGRWSGKPAVVPDWRPSPSLEQVPIQGIDPAAGTITVPGTDGKPWVIGVDQGTRIVFLPDHFDSVQTLADLKPGMVVSLSYEAAAIPAGRIARLVLTGSKLTPYITNGPWGTQQLWCLAIVTARTAQRLTARLDDRPASEILGLRFWQEAGSSAKPANNIWAVGRVADWAAHPDQRLEILLDRATEVLINGMKGSISDIRIGDHLGIEYRPEQTDAQRRPFLIFVYRYPPTPGAAPAPTANPDAREQGPMPLP